MTDLPIDGGLSPDLLLAERTTPSDGWTNPRNGFLVFLAIGTIAAGMALLVPGVLTLSLKSRIIDPAHPANLLSLAQAIAGVAQLIAFPLIGRFSDRTLFGIGRRRPFLLLGAALIAVGTLGAARCAERTPALVVANVVLAVGYSAVAVSAVSVIADQLAPHRRGPASAVVGLSLPVGALVGLFIAQLVSPNLALMILLPGALGVLGPIVFALLLRDRTITREERPSFSPRAVLETYWVNPAEEPVLRARLVEPPAHLLRRLGHPGVPGVLPDRDPALLARLGRERRVPLHTRAHGRPRSSSPRSPRSSPTGWAGGSRS